MAKEEQPKTTAEMRQHLAGLRLARLMIHEQREEVAIRFSDITEEYNRIVRLYHQSQSALKNLKKQEQDLDLDIQQVEASLKLEAPVEAQHD